MAFQAQGTNNATSPTVLIVDFPALPSDPAQMQQWYESFKTKLLSELSGLANSIVATQSQVSALQAQLQALTNQQ